MDNEVLDTYNFIHNRFTFLIDTNEFFLQPYNTCALYYVYNIDTIFIVNNIRYVPCLIHKKIIRFFHYE